MFAQARQVDRRSLSTYLKRIADIGIDLFVGLCVLSRARL